MNRIYKVIWSKTKHCYVVVSELAKRHTKGGSAGGCRMMTARVLSTLLLGAYLVGGYSLPSAWADGENTGGITRTESGDPTVYTTKIENQLTVTSDGKVQWGNQRDIDGAKGEGATAWGYQTYAIGAYSTAWGNSAKVEGDYSNAAFFEAFNCAGGSVAVTGLRPDSLQGDRVYRDFFPLLAKGPAELDLTDCPDLAPVLFVTAALCHGAVFTGTRRLRFKESDRGNVMAAEMAKFGVILNVEENRIAVPAGVPHHGGRGTAAGRGRQRSFLRRAGETRPGDPLRRDRRSGRDGLRPAGRAVAHPAPEFDSGAVP